MADPPQLPMHCSANVGKDGDMALFFGLSGTGKPTISADRHRALMAMTNMVDGKIFNFEGDCYAKTINLYVYGSSSSSRISLEELET